MKEIFLTINDTPKIVRREVIEKLDEISKTIARLFKWK